MRKAKRYRNLNAKEKAIAQSVFKNTIPYSRVVICDGLGIKDAPFTLPNGRNGEYVLSVGDSYRDMSLRKRDQALLIHELTHVWQGEHSGWRWNYVFNSMWHQGKSWVSDSTRDKAYEYDKNNLKSWNSYNVEQQAEIVEDWFEEGMKESDPRFHFIQFWIRGKRAFRRLPIPQMPRLRPIRFKLPHVCRIPSDVLFGFDSARLKPRAKEALKQATEILNQHGKGKTVVIEGHTDSIGDLNYNLRLSERRARAVRQMLIDLGTESAEQFQIKGYGETRPVAPNTTPEGRQENRRVEFRYR